MARENRKTSALEERILKRSTFLTGTLVCLAFSLFLGIVGVAIGLGSIFPRLNYVAGPFVCYGSTIEHSQQVTSVGSANYHSAEWRCLDQRSGERSLIEPLRLFIFSGLIYGSIIFALLVLTIYLYWHSGIGPAKNDGLRLW